MAASGREKKPGGLLGRALNCSSMAQDLHLIRAGGFIRGGGRAGQFQDSRASPWKFPRAFIAQGRAGKKTVWDARAKADPAYPRQSHFAQAAAHGITHCQSRRPALPWPRSLQAACQVTGRVKTQAGRTRWRKLQFILAESQ